MKTCLSVMVATAATVLASEARAQVDYSETMLNRLTHRSTAEAYSSDRMMRRTIISAVPQYNTIGVSSNLLAGAFGRPNKPFSSISKGPSVSPYLALDQPFTNTATAYYTQVRPRLEQQRINQQMERQTQLMQRQLAEVNSRPPYNPQGSEYMAPTGHASGFMTLTNNFMNYGGYYQQPRPQQR